MAFLKPVIAGILFLIVLEKYVESIETSNNNEETSSIPMIASGKRQHNIMRFGKRPAGGHNLIHFGKREDSRPQHSFLYFGKRSNAEQPLPDILQYLQKTRDNSYKRGHSIMRFGKRTSDMQHLNALEGSDNNEDYEEFYPNEEESKRNHNMMYFGKRGGHSMMYFGKRKPGMLSFGKRDDDKRAHSMIHFGKREDNDDEVLIPEDKRAHAMIHFGKREDDEDYLDELKRAHSMIHFGKREGDEDYLNELKRAHSMIHFGKREGDEDDLDELKRAHSMIHFGKREDDEDDLDELKRAHSMIHFGKRDEDDDSLIDWNPKNSEKKNHNLLRFGKKMDGMRKGSHAMIHFGKRDDDKRAHSMIHFGKRSIDEISPSTSNNNSEPSQPLTRMKRDLEDQVSGAVPVVIYGNDEDEDLVPEEELENVIRMFRPDIYHAGQNIDHLSYPDEEQALMSYQDYRPFQKKETSKNVFLRFG